MISSQDRVNVKNVQVTNISFSLVLAPMNPGKDSIIERSDQITFWLKCKV